MGRGEMENGAIGLFQRQPGFGRGAGVKGAMRQRGGPEGAIQRRLNPGT